MAEGKGIQWPGQNNFKAAPVVMFNRTGGNLVNGQLFAVDLLNTESETVKSNILRNAVALSAGNLDGLVGVVQINDGRSVIADDESFDAIMEGPVLALVDGGTIDVLGGDKLTVAAAATSFTRSDATTDIVWARALEANTGAAALKLVYLMSAPTAPGTDEA